MPNVAIHGTVAWWPSDLVARHRALEENPTLMLNAAHHPNRMSPTAFVSLSSGIVFVIATMVAVALLNVPKSAAAGAGSFSCPLTEVSLDQGYGVTRIGLVPVCVEAVDQAASGNTAAR